TRVDVAILLRHATHAQAAARDEFAFVRRFDAGENAHQRRFARAVGADQPDALALIQPERDPGKQHSLAVPFGEISAGQQHRGEDNGFAPTATRRRSRASLPKATAHDGFNRWRAPGYRT